MADPEDAAAAAGLSTAAAVAPDARRRATATNALQEVFQQFDQDGDGSISVNELTKVLQKLNPKQFSNASCKKMFDSIDVDKNGKVDFNEFIDWCMGKTGSWKSVQDSLAARSAATDEESKGTTDQDIERALQDYFKAYDMDESSELSREEFLKAESTLSLEGCDAFGGGNHFAKITLSDRDHSGSIDYEEFRIMQLTMFHENDLSHDEMLKWMQERTKLLMQARTRMGPRYHHGIRKCLKKIFSLYDVSGDGFLSPEEWIASQKIVAAEIGDNISESWIDARAFEKKDVNDDGFIELDEYLEASFSMFEEAFGKATGTQAASNKDLMETLTRVIAGMEKQRGKPHLQTRPLTLWQQSGAPSFRPPSLSWQDEPTPENPEANAEAWEESGEVILPADLGTVEEVVNALCLAMKLPLDHWLSVYYLGTVEGGASGSRKLCKLSTGNLEKALDYLTKPKAVDRLYVKNVRKIPSKLQKVQQVFLHERENILAKMTTGIVWGLDWETQTCGENVRKPYPMVLAPGDVLMVEVPQSDSHWEYRFKYSVWMDGTEVLSQPVDQDVDVETKKKKKNKKKKKGAAPEPEGPPTDQLCQLSFVGLQEGRCVLFVEVSWEDQEEKLAATYNLQRPVAENSVARIGPVEVIVQKPAAGAKTEALPLQWWNGDKWTAKKGPAKKKGKKK